MGRRVIGHAVVVQDATDHTSVVVCECSHAFLGYGTDREADALEYHAAHVRAAADYEQFHHNHGVPLALTPSSSTDDELRAALAAGVPYDRIRREHRVGALRLKRVYGSLTAEQLSQRTERMPGREGGGREPRHSDAVITQALREGMSIKRAAREFRTGGQRVRRLRDEMQQQDKAGA